MATLKSVFIETFGESPLIKVLDFFLMCAKSFAFRHAEKPSVFRAYPDFDYSKSQAAEESGISRITMDKIWSGLIKKEIIIKTREYGNAVLCKLNAKNPKVKILMKLDFELSAAAIEQEKSSDNNSVSGILLQKIGIPA